MTHFRRSQVRARAQTLPRLHHD